MAKQVYSFRLSEKANEILSEIAIAKQIKSISKRPISKSKLLDDLIVSPEGKKFFQRYL